ncbi:MAG: hypothetical protein RMJ55_11465 [Roseiflexaceae bacterium]|nr:hypothetical protein [Roseiflexaceae bacterium]MDW8392506.1 hypothetical protein [Oscillochloridaceae bacterium]
MQKVKAVVEVVAAFGLTLPLIAVEIAVLFTLGWLLKRKPTANENGIFLSAILPASCLELTHEARVGNAISAFWQGIAP